MTCINQGLPHLVQMQKKYGKDGLVILSVQLDSLDEKDLAKKVVTILKSKQATAFPTYILKEGEDVWQKKFGVHSYPFLYVFNREGRWTRFWADDDKYKKNKTIDPMLGEVDQLVGALLKGK